MSGLTYWFRETDQENQYRMQPDQQYPFYVMASIVLYLGIICIEALYLPENIIIHGCYFAGVTCLLIFAAIFWYAERTSGEIKTAAYLSHMTNSRGVRIGVYLFTACLAVTSAIFIVLTADTKDNEVILRVHQYSAALALTVGWAYLRAGFLLKFAVMILSVLGILGAVSQTLTVHMNEFLHIPYLVQTAYLLMVIVLILHVLDRQVEYTSRVDFLWKSKLKVEQDEVEIMRGINKILLENILPAHVADHFLATRGTQVSKCKLSIPLNLIQDQFSESNAAKIQPHWTKCTQIIKNVLSPYFQHCLRDDVGDRKFSLLLDESTDISVTKFLGIVIRYYSEKRETIVSTFLSLEELTSGTAEAILEAIERVANSFTLDLHNLMGIGTDNASIMIGVNNGITIDVSTGPRPAIIRL